MAKRYNESGIRLTDCCGAYSTFHDSALCCRKCMREVGSGEGDGLERKPAAASKPLKLGSKMREIPLREADRKGPDHASPFRKARRILDEIDISGLDDCELGALAGLILGEGNIGRDLASGIAIAFDRDELEELAAQIETRARFPG